MKHPYSTALKPPALVLAATVLDLAGRRRDDIELKVDTGADMTVIPEKCLLGVGVTPSGRIRVRSAFHEADERPTYFVRLELPEGSSSALEVLSSVRSYGLLGRDFLNQCVLQADGPRRQFELLVDKATGDNGPRSPVA